MAQFDDEMRNTMAKLLQAIKVSRIVKWDNVPRQIEEGLFLGSVGAANNKGALKSNNVTHILTVAKSLPPAYPKDFAYKIVGVADREDTNMSQYFDESFDFIDEAKRQGGGALVHCFVGMSRRHLVVIYRIPLQEAFRKAMI